jgi:hypothetical protein
MPHVLIIELPSEVAIQPDAVVSKVVHRGDGMNVTVFGFDTGEELTEHQAGPHCRGSGPVRTTSLHR